MDFSNGFSFQSDFVDLVNQAIQNGVSQSRITDMLDPVLNGDLGGNDRGRDRLAVFQPPVLG